MISTASPHLSRPFRHFGRWLIGLQFAGSLLLGADDGHRRHRGHRHRPARRRRRAPRRRLARRPPDGVAHPPGAGGPRRRRRGPGAGVDAAARGVQFVGTDHDGPLSVKVYGRDAWDGQLLANVWRLAWYRDTQRTVRLSRLELVEHEGFVTLLAERAGVRVPHLVTAGSAGRGDALVVVRPDGVPLRAWTGVARRRGDRRAVARPRPPARRRDRPPACRPRPRRRPRRRLDRVRRPLVGVRRRRPIRHAPGPGPGPDLALLLVGEDRAAAGARRALGDDGLLAVLPYVQEAAMPTGVRASLERPTSSSTTSAAVCAPCSGRRSSRSPGCAGSRGARCSTWRCWRSPPTR